MNVPVSQIRSASQPVDLLNWSRFVSLLKTFFYLRSIMERCVRDLKSKKVINEFRLTEKNMVNVCLVKHPHMMAWLTGWQLRFSTLVSLQTRPQPGRQAGTTQQHSGCWVIATASSKQYTYGVSGSQREELGRKGRN